MHAVRQRVFKSNVAISRLVNRKHRTPPPPPLPKRFAQLTPTLSTFPASNSSPSPPYNAIPMGKAGDHCISRVQCLQPIDRVNICIFLPHRYNSFNASRVHELKSVAQLCGVSNSVPTGNESSGHIS